MSRAGSACGTAAGQRDRLEPWPNHGCHGVTGETRYKITSTSIAMLLLKECVPCTGRTKHTQALVTAAAAARCTLRKSMDLGL